MLNNLAAVLTNNKVDDTLIFCRLFPHQLFGARNHDTLSRQMIAAEKNIN